MAVAPRAVIALALACAPAAEFPPSQLPPPDASGATAPDAAPPAGPDLAAPDTSPPALDPRGIASASVSGYQLLVRRRNADGSAAPPEPFDIRGISWSPAERGAGFPDSGAYLRAAERDLPLMRAAGINTVKTYLAVDRAVLDRMLVHGIVAIVTVLARSGDDFASAVESLRDHPAVLMWIVGNEWNYNRLYDTCALDACYARVAEVVAKIKQIDDRHPVATSFSPTAELPSASDLERLKAVDVWGLNVYSQPGFFNRFANWRLLAQQSGIQRPFFMSEYGADAWDNRAGRADEANQAAALRRQTQELRAQSSARNPALPCLGGTPFEWNDEWWKRGNPAVHDTAGFANQGVAGDQFANEEWWGIVDVDRNPRPAYQVLKELYAP
jgi:hypothetical protein